MKQLGILFLFLFVAFLSTAQERIQYRHDKSTGLVYDFNGRFDFEVSTTYDHDLETYGRGFPLRSIVLLKTGNDGKGKLILYIKEKVIFDVLSCRMANNEIAILMTNSNGREIKASLVVKNNTFYAFWLHNDESRVSTILYYKN